MASADDPECSFIATGGVGRHGPAEAEVMAGLLRDAGISATRIIEDRQAGDTLESVVNVAGIVRTAPAAARIVVCTSAYHIPRCLILFRLAGLVATRAEMPADRPHLGLVKWIYMCARELPAILWDSFLMVVVGRQSKSAPVPPGKS